MHHWGRRESDKAPDWDFRAMAAMFRVYDFFRERRQTFDRRLGAFAIRPGDTVVDYGCGIGGYLEAASRLVGPGGRVYAVDVQPLAIEAVRKKIARRNLGNITQVLARGYHCEVPGSSADLIYALDMLHAVRNPDLFLAECRRIVKPEGRLIVDDGHQSRSETRRRIEGSGQWRIDKETEDAVECRPK